MTIIAIEGLDGSGKTTQAKLLTQRFKKEGYRAKYLRTILMLSNVLSALTNTKMENILPSPRRIRTKEGNPLNRQRGIFFGIRGFFMGVFGYFYAVLSYVVIVYYSRNTIVVCDRFFYHFFFDLFGKWSRNLTRIFPKPDICFFLDCDLDILYSRMTTYSDRQTSKEYFKEVNSFYSDISTRYNFVKIDATLNRDEINNIIVSHILTYKNIIHG